MNELLSSELWTQIRKIAKKSKRKAAAVAYVTDDRYFQFGEGDILVTDASDEAIKSGQTSAAVLKAAWNRGAEITSLAGLHSKVYVFDRIAIVGSANLSRESERRTEAAIFTDQPAIVSSSRLFIEQLKIAGQAVDEKFIVRISKLPVTKSRKTSSGRKSKKAEDYRPRTWLVGLKETAEKDSERELVEEGMEEAEKHVSEEDSSVSWIRFRGSSRFRKEAKAGDVVVCIWSEGSKSKPNRVYHHAPILLRKDDKDADVTWFYVEEYPDAEDSTISWKRFQKLSSQIGLPGKPSQWAAREIASHHSEALHNLWSDG